MLIDKFIDDFDVNIDLLYKDKVEKKLKRKMPVVLEISIESIVDSFNEILIESLQKTVEYLCQSIRGCILGYIRFDNIVLIIDCEGDKSLAWFNYNIQKMCSITASRATLFFNKTFLDTMQVNYYKEYHSLGLDNAWDKTKEEYDKNFTFLKKKYELYYTNVNEVIFDCKCFNIPKEEIENLIFIHLRTYIEIQKMNDNLADEKWIKFTNFNNFLYVNVKNIDKMNE